MVIGFQYIQYMFRGLNTHKFKIILIFLIILKSENKVIMENVRDEPNNTHQADKTVQIKLVHP